MILLKVLFFNFQTIFRNFDFGFRPSCSVTTSTTMPTMMAECTFTMESARLCWQAVSKI